MSADEAQPRPLDVATILDAFDRHGVRSVLIGGAAAMVHGSPLSTIDVDFVPAPGTENLNRLGRALRDLEAVPVPDPDHPNPGSLADIEDFGFVAEALRRRPVWHLETRAGLVDLVFRPAGFATGYDGLAPGASRFELFGHEVEVATLEQVIVSKRAANRPKDVAALLVLEQLAEHLDKHPQPSRTLGEVVAEPPHRPEPMGAHVSEADAAPRVPWVKRLRQRHGSRPRQAPPTGAAPARCGHIVDSTGRACLLRRGHRGRCRSR